LPSLPGWWLPRSSRSGSRDALPAGAHMRPGT
jgi:hypothetical protein